MPYVVLVQNKLGLRDAFYVNGDNMLEATQNACKIMMQVSMKEPSFITVLPSAGNRGVGYMFPRDAETDTELIMDFLRGYIRTVRMTYQLMCELGEDDNTEAERETEQDTEEYRQDTPLLRRMRRFLQEDALAACSNE